MNNIDNRYGLNDTDWERAQSKEMEEGIDTGRLLSKLLDDRTVRQVNIRIVDVFQTRGIHIFPQKPDNVKSVLLHQYNIWFNERTVLVINGYPKTADKLMDELIKRAIEYAVNNMSNNYLSQKAFRRHQNTLPTPVAHPTNVSMTGTRITRTGFVHLE